MSTEPAGTPETPKPKKKLPKTALIVAAITIVQAVGFFFAFKMFAGGPQATYGHEGAHYAHEPEVTTRPAATATVEIPLMQRFRVPNKKSGVLYIYDLDVVVVSPADRKEEVEKLKTERAGEVADRLGQILRAADPQVLNEDDFRTLRLQMQAALGAIAEDPELVQRVLIPRCVPIRSD
ncbi:MAG: hypothetical protein AB7Q17_12125 [Phycisphaerae bacterium]